MRCNALRVLGIVEQVTRCRGPPFSPTYEVLEDQAVRDGFRHVTLPPEDLSIFDAVLKDQGREWERADDSLPPAKSPANSRIPPQKSSTEGGG